MGIDIWEVVDAAATKPFGFMRFDPGPGMGGHCLPVDPFYLAWRAREFDFYTEFIELAGKINQSMPYFCVDKIERTLNDQGKPVHGSRILLLGVAYKPGVGDLRESPALKILKLLGKRGAELSYHDPHVPVLPEAHLESVPLRAGARESRSRRDRDRPSAGRLSPRRFGGTAGARLPRRHARDRVEQPRAPVTPARDTIAVGVVGLGYWGPNLARNFAALDGCELRWCCDRSEESLDRWRSAFPGTLFTPVLDDLLADDGLDAVVVATDVPSHAPIALAALGAGKHCFVEKPLSQSSEEAAEIVAASQGAGLILMVGHLLEYHPGVAKLKEIVDSGELGEVRYVYSNRLNLGQGP